VTAQLVRLAVVAVWALAVGACAPFISGDQPDTVCGAFAENGCEDLAKAGLAAVKGARADAPQVVVVEDRCPPSARCMPSTLGGITVAVAAAWADGTVRWATIDLGPEWPNGPVGPAVAQADAPPSHVMESIGG
jgi:hypothetical protein